MATEVSVIQEEGIILINEGLRHVLQTADYPYFSIKYSLPIYDHRTDIDIHSAPGTNALSAINNAESEPMSATDSYTRDGVYGEMLFKIADDSEYIRVGDQLIAYTDATISGMTADTNLSELDNNVNLVKEDGDYYLPIRTNTVSSSASSIVTATGVGQFNATSWTELAQSPNMLATLGTQDWSRDTLYQNVSYAASSVAGTNTGIYNLQFGGDIGDFKFNKLILFIQKMNVDGTEDTTYNPVPFAVVAYNKNIECNSSGSVDTYVAQFRMSFNRSTASQEITYFADDYWFSIPASSAVDGTSAVEYKGSVLISPALTGVNESSPKAKLDIIDNTNSVPLIRIARAQSSESSGAFININVETSALQLYNLDNGRVEIGKHNFATNEQALATGYGTSATNKSALSAGWNTLASGENSFVSGQETTATGVCSCASGYLTLATGMCSDASCNATTATGTGAVSIGYKTVASGIASFATGQETSAKFTATATLGYKTVASGLFSMAIGNEAFAYGQTSFAAGYKTHARESGSFAIGYDTYADGFCSFVAGGESSATGKYSFAAGSSAVAEGLNSFAAGIATSATGENSAVFGSNSIASGKSSFAAGYLTSATSENSTVFGSNSIASGLNSFAAGIATSATGENSTVFGSNSRASGQNSFAIGSGTLASNMTSVAFGNATSATGNYSVAAGYGSIASVTGAIAIGSENKSYGAYSLAIGIETQAGNNAAFASGYHTSASGLYSFSAGYKTKSTNDESVAFGYDTSATGEASFVSGIRSIAGGTGSFSYGCETTASAAYAVSIGYQTFVSGQRSFAWGYRTSAIGEHTYSVGNESKATNDYSMTIGNYNDASGENAISVGSHNQIDLGVDYCNQFGSYLQASNTGGSKISYLTQIGNYSSTDVYSLQHIYENINIGMGYDYSSSYTVNLTTIGAGISDSDRVDAFVIGGIGQLSSFSEQGYTVILMPTTGSVIENSRRIPDETDTITLSRMPNGTVYTYNDGTRTHLCVQS